MTSELRVPATAYRIQGNDPIDYFGHCINCGGSYPKNWLTVEGHYKTCTSYVVEFEDRERKIGPFINFHSRRDHEQGQR